MRCPFHAGDRTASLKVYDAAPNPRKRGWYCFGCQAGGSVIDFVMKMESCSFAEAVRAIDRDLNLNLLRPEPPEKLEKRREFLRALDELEARFLEEIDREDRHLSAEYEKDYAAWAELDLIPKRSRSAADWTHLENHYESLRYLEYKRSELEELRKKVHAWKNKCRFMKPCPKS